MSTAQEVIRQLRAQEHANRHGQSSSSAPKRIHQINEAFIAEEEEEEQEPVPWECPIDIECVADLQEKVIIESLLDDETYEFASRKAISNLRDLFRNAIDVLEELEFK